jgi:bacterioferritin (cytochrome b1)
MIGNPEVLAALQSAVAAEVHLNAQYRADWRSVRFIGAKKTAKKIKEFGSDAHEWVKCVQDRLLLLGGDLSYSPGAIVQAPTLTATFTAELALENAARTIYQSIAKVADADDATTVHKAQHLKMYHEEHVGWLEQQLRIIASKSEADYILEMA